MDGTWGFSATGDASVGAVVNPIDRARSAARAGAALRQTRIDALPEVSLATGDYVDASAERVDQLSLDERVELALSVERRTGPPSAARRALVTTAR